MKYYIIVGEASGDLHASNLMYSLKRHDSEAEFRFFGGDLMAAAGGTLVKHYRELAYMGFVQVALHAGTILSNMRLCKEDIVAWSPDVVILVDYPGFNLSIAKFVKTHTKIPVYYYISPKIWAWKEYRIKDIRLYVDEMFSILPFEVPFYAKHHYPIHYVGNPSVDSVAQFKASYTESHEEFCNRHKLNPQIPIVALLAGSRKQEINDNLPIMLAATKHFKGFQWVIAGAPGIEKVMYDNFTDCNNKSSHPVSVVYNETYALLTHSHSAMVTSGTATLETALFRVPQVVCYYIMCGKVVSWIRNIILKVRHISLVNLIADFTVVRELVADEMREQELKEELNQLLLDNFYRERMLDEYDKMVLAPLGEPGASEHAATKIIELLKQQRERY